MKIETKNSKNTNNLLFCLPHIHTPIFYILNNHHISIY